MLEVALSVSTPPVSFYFLYKDQDLSGYNNVHTRVGSLWVSWNQAVRTSAFLHFMSASAPSEEGYQPKNYTEDLVRTFVLNFLAILAALSFHDLSAFFVYHKQTVDNLTHTQA